MVTKKILIILAVVLFAGSGLYAVPVDKIFTSDGIINEGDRYHNVFIYDTPPHRTTVSMFGGWVSLIQSYDSSIFSMFGGTIEALAYNQSTINVGGGTIHTLLSYDFSNVNVFGGFAYSITAYDTTTVNVFDNANLFSLFAHDSGVVNMSGGITKGIGVAESGTVNLYGGLITGISAGDSGTINLYGYGLSKFLTGGNYGFGFVSGQWQTGIQFYIDLGSPDTYSHVMLHEIPEPATVLLIAIGGVYLRKRRAF